MKEKILIISPYLPYDNVGHAGGKVIYDFIAHLKKRNVRVYLISLVTPDEISELEDLKSLCDDTCFLIFEPLFSTGFMKLFLRSPLSAIFKLPFALICHFMIRWKLAHHSQRLVNRYDPDIIQVEYSMMAIYLSEIRSTKLRVLNLHDVMLKPLERLYEAEKNFLRRGLRFLLFLFVKRREISFCRQFDKILVKSEFDKQLLLKQGNFEIEIFPLGIETVSRIEPYENREPNSILFVGALYNDLNERAVLYFIKEVLPKLKQNLGFVKFYVVGSSPSQGLKKMSSESVIIKGFVDDLSLFYNRCGVFVAPLFVGGGMILKILQAMSYGLPVVSSTIANEGILAKDNEEILLADSAEDFCHKTGLILRDKELWQRISNGGRSFVNCRYSWDIVLDDYLRLFNQGILAKAEVRKGLTAFF